MLTNFLTHLRTRLSFGCGDKGGKAFELFNIPIHQRVCASLTGHVYHVFSGHNALSFSWVYKIFLLVLTAFAACSAVSNKPQ